MCQIYEVAENTCLNIQQKEVIKDVRDWILLAFTIQKTYSAECTQFALAPLQHK